MDLPLSICKCVQLCVNCFLLSLLLPMTHCLCIYVCVNVCLCVCVWKKNMVRGERCQPCVLSLWSIWQWEGVMWTVVCVDEVGEILFCAYEYVCVSVSVSLHILYESDLCLCGKNIILDNFQSEISALWTEGWLATVILNLLKSQPICIMHDLIIVLISELYNQKLSDEHSWLSTVT